MTALLSVAWAILSSRIGLAACTFAAGIATGLWWAHDYGVGQDLRQEIAVKQRDLDAAKAAATTGKELLARLQAQRDRDGEKISAYEDQLAKAERVPALPRIDDAPAPRFEPPVQPPKVQPPRILVPRRDPCRLTDGDIGSLQPIGR